jgi:hypothetical protein
VKPGSTWLPGHDARYHGRIKRICDGRLTLTGLEALLEDKSVLRNYRKAVRAGEATWFGGDGKPKND